MRRSTVLLSVALVIGVAACGDDGGEAASTSTTTSAPTSSTSSPGSDTSVPALESANTAEAWLTALADGDMDAAWALVAPASREAIGGRPGFDAVATDLAEGWAAFGRAQGLEYEVVGRAGGADLVLLRGEVEREGSVEDAAEVLPVRDGRVEPFADAGHVEMPLEVGGDGSFDVFALVEREVVAFADGRPAEEIAQAGADGDQTRWSFRAPSPDPEVVVAAAVADDGGITAEAAVVGGAG